MQSSPVERWVLFDPASGGFGATAFGTWFGSSTGTGVWGLFSSTLEVGATEVSCEKCGRLRRTIARGGAAFFGSYVAGNHYYVVVSDLTPPITCFSLRFTGPETFLVDLSAGVGAPPPILADAPAQTSEVLPPGQPSANALLLATLPEVTRTGTYTVSIVNTCAGTETVLASIFLEAEPMLMTPQDADLNGLFPLALLRRFVPDPLPHSGVRSAIPLDFCRAVIEYDARLGTDPSAQGWTHGTASAGSPSDFTVLNGGALEIDTTGPNDSYFERILTLPVAPGSRCAMYAYYMPEDLPASFNTGAGLNFEASFAAAAADYNGVRIAQRDNFLYGVQLAGFSENVAGNIARRGWNRVLAETSISPARNRISNDNLTVETFAFGTSPGPAPAHRLTARFGDFLGEGLHAYLRNIVASAPGRFIRAFFDTYTQVSAPILRLYLYADPPATADRLIRLRIRYGSGTANPAGIPTSVVDQTVNFSTTLSMLEVPIQLTGLTSNSTIRFSVERVAAHAEDTMQGTAWLTHATLRAA